MLEGRCSGRSSAGWTSSAAVRASKGNGTLNERERERDGIYCQQCNTNTQQSTATAGIAGTHNQQCRERRICFDTHDVMILRREVEKHETGHNNHTKQTQPRGRSLELRTNNNSEEEEEKVAR